MIKLFSVKVTTLSDNRFEDIDEKFLTHAYKLLQEKQKKDAAAGKGVKQSAGELRLQKGWCMTLLW